MGLFDFLKRKTATEPKTTSPSTKTVSVAVPQKTPLVSVKTDIIYDSPTVDEPPPLESLLKDAIPSKEGLYPHEILMLDYAHTYKTSNNSFQGFWYYQYSVRDPQAVLNALYERGFLQTGDLRSALDRLKLPELKDELKVLGEKVSGKKSDLVERLLAVGDHDALSQKYPERYFTLTEKGQQELKANEYVSYLHRHRYMSIWEMNRELANAKRGFSYRDVLWGYFNKESMRHFSDYNFGLYRNIRLNMYQFLLEEKKHQGAFDLLCEVIVYDLSGLSNNDDYLFKPVDESPDFYIPLFEMKIESCFPYEKSLAALPPAIIRWLGDKQRELGIGEDDFRKLLLEKFEAIKLPSRIFSNVECADIALAEVKDDKETLQTIYKRAERREKGKLSALKKQYNIR